MNNQLTVQILTRDCESEIKTCFDSMSSLECAFLVGDMGSKDSTREVCQLYDAKVVRLSLSSNLAKSRNELATHSTTAWNMWILPTESLIAGPEEINHAIHGNKGCFNLNVIQADLVTKSARIWHKEMGAKFKNHAFESLDCRASDITAYLALRKPYSVADNLQICKDWHTSSPLSAEPLYYLACAHLQNGNNQSFLNCAQAYLHQDKKQSMSFFMIHYYMSMVFCYQKKDLQMALQSIIPCVIKQPTMSEFWCVLGDIFYQGGDYIKAISFYENALYLGERRKSDSPWPMEISKYYDYPQKMIASCKVLVGESKLYIGKANTQDQSR